MRSLLAFGMLVALVAMAAPDPAVVMLPEVAVRENAVGAAELVGSGSDAARPAAPAAAFLVPQGGGAQADLSLRGSSFSETGYSLAGLSLRNPQTEHFNAELPLPPELLADLRALTGLEQALDSSGHLAGSVAAEFAPVAPGTTVELRGGETGGYGERLWHGRALEGSGSWRGAVFAGQQWLPGLDHGHNEAEALSGGLHLQRRLAEQSFDAVAAVQERAFGARGFYGVSPARRSVESTQDALALASWRLGLAQPADFVRTTASVRRFADDYILDDKDPPYYRNQHRTLISSAAADGRLSGGERVALTWRVWAEDERIDSGGVFKGAGTRGLGRHDRQRLGAMLLPELALGDLTLRGGGQAVLFSEDSPVALALAGADYAAGDRHHLYASVTQQVRQPSFTELDYESPASLGNAGLGNERSTEVEAGLKSSWSPTCRTRVAGFRRRTKDTIDWVRQAPGGRWLATDLGEVTTTGIEAEAAYSPSPNLALSLFGQSLTKRGEMDIYASRYVYNYPEERLGLAACWSPVAWCELRTQQTVMVHADNPARTSDRWGTESSLAVAVKPPHWTGLALGLEVTNLFDDDTQLLPGQKRSGQRVMGTVKACW